jgi:hypothetical protein
MLDDARDSYEHLYKISVTTLGLSESAIKMVYRVGITNIGDCIDWYRRVPTVGVVPFGFISTMLGEVQQKIIEHGFWNYVGRPPFGEG